MLVRGDMAGNTARAVLAGGNGTRLPGPGPGKRGAGRATAGKVNVGLVGPAGI